jgi:hypothetical protein
MKRTYAELTGGTCGVGNPDKDSPQQMSTGEEDWTVQPFQAFFRFLYIFLIFLLLTLSGDTT